VLNELRDAGEITSTGKGSGARWHQQPTLGARSEQNRRLILSRLGSALEASGMVDDVSTPI
jgi:hypothetical protein